MKLLAVLPLAVLAADAVVASVVPDRHHRIARRMNRKKRCVARPQNTMTNNNNVVQPSNTSPPVTYPTTTSPPAQEPPAQQQPATTTTQAPPASNPPAQPQSGTINVASSCGDIGATSEPSTTSGPNGSIYWLNCGIQDGGWRPPFFTTHDVVAQDLGTVLSWPGNPYSACGPFLDAFYQYASQYDVPAILLAAIAMQESSCNPNAIGGNGEQGLMQITVDKCPGGYGSEACRDPWYNIGAGASYLRRTLDSVGGSLPEALGQYNGWRKGMTFDDATRARYQGHCFAQNNLDYLHQTFNGWIQGIDPRARGMGVFFNLNGC